MDLLALLAAFFLVLLNGFFVATEFAIVKVRPSRIEQLIRDKRPGARGVRHMVTHLDSYLSATQFGITLASLGLGWLGEPAFARLIEPLLTGVGIESPLWIHRIAVFAAFGTISFLHIVVGELAPKSLALLRAESVALLAYYPMRLIHTLFYPFIWILNGLANGLLKSIGIDATEGHRDHHSEEELKIIVSQARSAGLLAGPRADLLDKAIGLSSKTARHMMVPRNDVVFLDINVPLEENLERAMASDYSRFPICDRELDNTLGVVRIRDLLSAIRKDPDLDIQTIILSIAFFPEIMSADRLMAEFPKRDSHMAIVVDEYGGASGILTPNDIVSTVMGELEEEDEQELVQLPSGAYDIEGGLELEELEDALSVKLPCDDMTTIAGFLMSRLGRMPQVGDKVHEAGYTFQVMELSGPRVKSVRVHPSHGRPQRVSEYPPPVANREAG